MVLFEIKNSVTSRRNTTIVGLDPSAITCENLASTGNIEIRLQNACDSFWTIGSCPPLHISVQSETGGVDATSAICTGMIYIQNYMGISLILIIVISVTFLIEYLVMVDY